MYKYLVGSKMLGLDNCRDEDWIIFNDTSSPEEKSQIQYRRIDFQRFINQTFIDGNNFASDSFKALMLYQISREFYDKVDYPFNDFSILEHKPVWITHLQNYINLNLIQSDIEGKDILPKWFYHILYQYYMIIEDTVWISDEGKAIVQKIHDLEMPASYFYELRDKINNLKIEE